MADSTLVRLLDCRGMRCPLPLLKTRQALRDNACGSVLRVVLDDSGSVVDVPRWLIANGHTILKQQQCGNQYELLVRKSGL